MASLGATRSDAADARRSERWELQVIGLVDRKDARGTVVAARRQRPLERTVVPPTLRVESFKATSNAC
jgi:hypothetical protein